MARHKIPEKQGRKTGANNKRSFDLPAGSHLVIGRRACSEVVRHCPQKIVSAYVTTQTATLITELIEKGGVKSFPIRTSTTEELDQICAAAAHQGIILAMKERENLPLKSLGDNSSDAPSLIVILSRIEDPHNFGAVLRAAECFGADGVVWSYNRGAPITHTVTKVSVGASELVPLFEVSNIAQAIEQLKKLGYWVVAADLKPQALSISDFEFPKRTALLLGAEHDGLKNLLSSKVDFMVKIPMQGKIDSLNVSQAAAVLMSYYAKTYSRGQS